MGVFVSLLIDSVSLTEYISVMETLYRATNRKSDAKNIPVGSCWSDDIATAQAYADNPGFGGAHIVSATVDMGNYADWTDAAGGIKQMFGDLFGADFMMNDEAYLLYSEWKGYEIFQAIENSMLSSLVAEKYNWIIYTDDYPEGATTYRRMS